MAIFDQGWDENRSVNRRAGMVSPRPCGMEEGESPPPGTGAGTGVKISIKTHRNVISPWRSGEGDPDRAGFTARRTSLFGSREDRTPVQLVPERGSRKFYLFAGGRFTAQAGQEGVAAVRSLGGSQYALDGLTAGPTLIHAVNKRGVCESEMQVFVTGEMRIPLGFRHYVYEEGGKRVRDSPWSQGRVKELLKGINDIYVPQANIRFYLAPAPWEAKASLDYGDPLDIENKAIQADITKHSSSGLFTALLVNKLAGWDISSRTTGGTLLHLQHFVFVAHATNLQLAVTRVAHEVGHHLVQQLYSGSGGHHPDKRHLMYELEKNGGYIDFPEAMAMRTWLIDEAPRPLDVAPPGSPWWTSMEI